MTRSEMEFEDDDVVLVEETSEIINNMNPGRQKQVNLLLNLIGTPGDPLPPSVFVFGDAATGKSKVVKDVLEMSSAHFAVINCVETYTARLLLEPILDKLLGAECGDAGKCDSVMELVNLLKVAAHKGQLSDQPCVIVLDNCERLFELGDHYFAAFQKLQELTSLHNLCVIFISQILPEKFSAEVPHIRVFFPQYTKEEVTQILLSLKEEEGEEEQVKSLFRQFLKIFLDIFYLATRDLNELIHQVNALFPKYLEPVHSGSVKATDTHALYRHIAPHIRASLCNVYLPGTGQVEANKSEPVGTKVLRTLDLPWYAKYLLVAAFLASYNSPKDDKRLFVKNHGGRKKKRLVQDQKRQNASRELLGPKVFTLDRLLAIFYAIMEETTPLNANLMAQISTLVELRLLVRLGDDLDRPKHKCAVGLDCVEAVARTLQFNVRKYMVN